MSVWIFGKYLRFFFQKSEPMVWDNMHSYLRSILTLYLLSAKRDQIPWGANLSSNITLKKSLHLKEFDPSQLLIDLELRWIYTNVLELCFNIWKSFMETFHNFLLSRQWIFCLFFLLSMGYLLIGCPKIILYVNSLTKFHLSWIRADIIFFYLTIF